MATSAPTAAAASVTAGLSGVAKLLVTNQIVAEKAAVALQAKAKSEGMTFLQALSLDNKALSRKAAELLAQTFEMGLIDLDAVSEDAFPSTALSDPKKIEELRAVPVFVRGPKMFIAVSDPTITKGLEFFTHKAGKRHELVVVDDAQITALLASINGGASNAGGMDDADDVDFEADMFGTEAASTEDETAEANRQDSPVIKLVNSVLIRSIKMGASDIHFEPYEKFYRIRVRVDGTMRELMRQPLRSAVFIASRIKVISSLNIAEKRTPQDGRMKLKIAGGRAIDFRVSTLPVMYGEKIVMRILDPAAASLGIDALGYEPDEKARLLEAIGRPYGMVLVTGPTGSGKTVSLYTCLNILNKVDINISTAEDPCEIQLAGINQVNVNPAQGLTFAGALKSFLRQDPDIIMVGEIRDEETAEISVKAAQTGHMVLATLHTNDAPKTISRLIEIGVKPYNVAGAITLITAQRLARKLCVECKVPDDGQIPEALVDLGMTKEEAEGVYRVWKPYKANAEGCSLCNSGYKGRLGIYQVMPISEGIRKHINLGSDAMLIAEQAKLDGVRDLRQSALLKYRRGLLSMEEVLAVTNE